MVRVDITFNVAARSVTIDASASQPGIAPIASYEFKFDDGSVVTQTSPVATHTYAQPGSYLIQTKVTGTDGRSGYRNDRISVLPVIGSFGLLSLYNLKFVATSPDHPNLEPTRRAQRWQASSTLSTRARLTWPSSPAPRAAT